MYFNTRTQNKTKVTLQKAKSDGKKYRIQEEEREKNRVCKGFVMRKINKKYMKSKKRTDWQTERMNNMTPT